MSGVVPGRWLTRVPNGSFLYTNHEEPSIGLAIRKGGPERPTARPAAEAGGGPHRRLLSVTSPKVMKI